MTKTLLYLFLLLSTASLSQITKTLRDTSFQAGDLIALPEIYFMEDDRGHRNDSAYQAIAGFLSLHKNIKVEIGSHTDSRGSASNNLTLSKARASHMREELIKRFNVDSNQVTSKGYGSSKAIKSDAEISRTKTKAQKEELHQMNRRMELKVLSIN